MAFAGVLRVAVLGALAGCGLSRFEQRGAPDKPFDAVIVLGCPSLPDGSPSRCQLARAVWATVLWERGWVERFITSGSDVHTPHVEAEALAQVMTALGVPPDRIYLEPDALHTDENMYFSLRIAQKLGARRVGVVSTRGHALFACRMAADWGSDCRALGLDLDAVRPRADAEVARLRGLRLRPTRDWRTMLEREHELTERFGRHRPPSWMLYLSLAMSWGAGDTWVPIPPRELSLVTWADRLRAEMAP